MCLQKNISDASPKKERERDKTEIGLFPSHP